MNPREVYLYSRGDGTCTLKLHNEEPPREFADVIEALDFVQSLPELNGVTLSVYDPLGYASIKLPL